MPRCSARDTCCTGRHCPGSRAWRPRPRRRGGCSAPCRGWGSSDAAREGAEGRVGLGVGTPLPRYRGMHSDEERLYLLLDRYLAGEASAGDAQAVRDWLAEHPDHPLFLDDLRLIRRVAAERTPESSVDAAWAKEQRPLRVHTTQSVTEDLGTAFVIRAYADQVATEVVVAEGRVTLSRADTTAATRTPALVLEARDLGRLDPSGVAAVRRGVDVGRYLAWTRGVLAFDGTPLGDVVLTLGRWYNVEIRLADSALAARRP